MCVEQNMFGVGDAANRMAKRIGKQKEYAKEKIEAQNKRMMHRPTLSKVQMSQVVGATRKTMNGVHASGLPIGMPNLQQIAIKHTMTVGSPHDLPQRDP